MSLMFEENHKDILSNYSEIWNIIKDLSGKYFALN